MNRIDTLCFNGLKIIQHDDVFSFSIDAVLLGHFASIPNKGHIIDLCAGNGAVGLLLSERTNATITMIEIQERLCQMAQESIALNRKENQCQIIHTPLQQALTHIPHDSVDAIVCNPPYFALNEQTKINPNPYLAIARHEIEATLDDVMRCAKQLLKTKGKITLVHRPDRLLDIIHAMNNEGISPKTLRFIYPKQNKEANMVIIEGIKGGKAKGLKVLSPFYVHYNNGDYTEEMKEIFQNG